MYFPQSWAGLGRMGVPSEETSCPHAVPDPRESPRPVGTSVLIRWLGGWGPVSRPAEAATVGLRKSPEDM